MMPAVWVIDLGTVGNNAVRVILVVVFALLAIGLPPILQARARIGRRAEADELGVLIWLIFAAGIAAIVVRWDAPLLAIVTLLRVGVAVIGVHYLWRNRRALIR